MLRSSLIRASTSSAAVIPSAATRQAVRFSRPASLVCIKQQSRKVHAVSNPTLANIEKRWEDMPPQEQADLWMTLRDRMKADWNELTLQEKKAAYWIAFGPHGPRALPPPGETTKVVLYTFLGVVASGVLFWGTRYFANNEVPRTMTKEWQEASEEYLKAQGSEPITGYKGMLVQSKPGPKGQFDEDDE
ncbi:mitochondrial cytochrome c oxidase-like protein subunit V [Mytilinidion resinicola]|uniref:Cytochrome c oxidase polypeptide V n=1 Tax=Mytilinidion resinicola TaxID=574789 RepID=A0A6A6YPW4_9PEZI|nr:mitochondrial cytochrome c oxidase-like protein subunit V [Mytilinidion resinicola]KAF2810791.1 mitochondrial cytochrome c oxidase-like protein subunit V [Mytilinidion resinicola]